MLSRFVIRIHMLSEHFQDHLSCKPQFLNRHSSTSLDAQPEIFCHSIHIWNEHTPIPSQLSRLCLFPPYRHGVQTLGTVTVQAVCRVTVSWVTRDPRNPGNNNLTVHCIYYIEWNATLRLQVLTIYWFVPPPAERRSLWFQVVVSRLHCILLLGKTYYHI